MVIVARNRLFSSLPFPHPPFFCTTNECMLKLTALLGHSKHLSLFVNREQMQCLQLHHVLFNASYSSLKKYATLCPQQARGNMVPWTTLNAWPSPRPVVHGHFLWHGFNAGLGCGCSQEGAGECALLGWVQERASPHAPHNGRSMS